MSKRLLVLAVPVLALTLLGAACSSDDGGDVTGNGSASGSGSTASADCDVSHGTTAKRTDEVHAELTEWSITLDKKTVKAGNIEFDVKNTGRETHEFVIVQG